MSALSWCIAIGCLLVSLLCAAVCVRLVRYSVQREEHCSQQSPLLPPRPERPAERAVVRTSERAIARLSHREMHRRKAARSG